MVLSLIINNDSYRCPSSVMFLCAICSVNIWELFLENIFLIRVFCHFFHFFAERFSFYLSRDFHF